MFDVWKMAKMPLASFLFCTVHRAKRHFSHSPDHCCSLSDVARGQQLPTQWMRDCGVDSERTTWDFICLLPPNIRGKHKQQRMERQRVTHMTKCPKKPCNTKFIEIPNAYIIFFDPNSYFNSVVEVGGFQKDRQKMIISENVEGYWSIFFRKFMCYLEFLTMISREWTWGPLVTELLNAFAKIGHWNERNT